MKFVCIPTFFLFQIINGQFIFYAIGFGFLSQFIFKIFSFFRLDLCYLESIVGKRGNGNGLFNFMACSSGQPDNGRRYISDRLNFTGKSQLNFRIILVIGTYRDGLVDLIFI